MKPMSWGSWTLDVLKKLATSPFNWESYLGMLAVKVRLRKLDLIELREGSSSLSKAEIWFYGFIFGIDVSSRKSNVCILVNDQEMKSYAISNDMLGFTQLLNDLKQVTNPQIIFEATGVYSRRLQAFLDKH